MRRPGIEPGPPAWQASILPLNQRRTPIFLCCFEIGFHWSFISDGHFFGWWEKGNKDCCERVLCNERKILGGQKKEGIMGNIAGYSGQFDGIWNKIRVLKPVIQPNGNQIHMFSCKFDFKHQASLMNLKHSTMDFIHENLHSTTRFSMTGRL